MSLGTGHGGIGRIGHNEYVKPSPPLAIFAGLATVDIVQLVERLPRANEKITALEFLVAAGGPAANAAVAFAHCGGAPTLVTALPEHPMSALVIGDLAAHRVDVVVRGDYDGPPITASILVTLSTGERAVVSPSRVASDAAVASGDVEPLALDGIGAVLIDGYFGALSVPIAQAARALGIPVILDGGSFKSHTDDVLAAANIAVVSEDFAPPGTGGEPAAVFAYLRALGVTHAAITRGARDILFVTPTTSGGVPVTPVPVVDTLGAGDFFHGAFTFRVAALGLSDERFAEDLAFAAEVAGRSLGSFGTRAWLGAT